MVSKRFFPKMIKISWFNKHNNSTKKLILDFNLQQYLHCKMTTFSSKILKFSNKDKTQIEIEK